MSSCEFPASSKSDQITNHPTNQGRHRTKPCLCCEYGVSLSASALAGVEGYTQINLSLGAGGRYVDTPAKGIFLLNRECIEQRIQYPPCQFITQRINRLERGVTKP